MAFTVEDGTVVSGANAYITVAAANAYHTERGNAAWTGSDTVKEQAIVRATDYLEGRFGARFIGRIFSADQFLSWPRDDISTITTTEIPLGIQQATAEYALRALTTSLAPDPEVDASGYVRVVEERQIGPLRTRYAVRSTDGNFMPATFRPYPLADMLLRGLVRPSGRVYR